MTWERGRVRDWPQRAAGHRRRDTARRPGPAAETAMTAHKLDGDEPFFREWTGRSPGQVRSL